MTERERCEQLVEDIRKTRGRFHAITTHEAIDLLTQALEQTRREALEEAAKVAERFQAESLTDYRITGGNLREWYELICRDVAKHIRAQAQRQGPSDQRGATDPACRSDSPQSPG